MTPSNANTSGLAPCPFCGGEAWLNDYEAKYSDLPPMSRAPQCRSCGASLGYLTTPAKATEAWNRRVTAASAQARIAELEVELEEARTIDAGFWKWLGERDLQPDGPDVEWGDIVVALTEHEDNAYDIADKANDRATAAEARADRLADGITNAILIAANLARDLDALDAGFSKSQRTAKTVRAMAEMRFRAATLIQCAKDALKALGQDQ